ncbi:MAG TPA: hypothetical protein PLX02_12945 [Syntrophorhabdaceae bacterium]|nr:hypothetical protein [Syntrophorhabdaceae bacterium]HQM82517.1 hypothetical protein [Syntrophorhabdaceae bacterium]
MKLCGRLLLLVFLLFSFASEGHAKWWIFGTSEDNVELQYIYLNKVGFSETGTKVTLFREMLPNGMVMIQGKATAGMNKIGSARVSTDGKQTWLDMKLSENGAFEYGFKPEINKPYKIYVEITDTRGKTNNVDSTLKEVVVSTQNIYAIVKSILDSLIDAYQREKPQEFMAFVSDDFTGDKTLLDRAVRKDFSAFDNIMLRYVLTNVSVDTTGKIFVTFNFNRQVTSVRSGKTLQDNATTQMTFKLGDRGGKIYSMKWPLIFGLSDATNVAQGTVAETPATNVIVVDTRGETKTVPYQESVTFVEQGGTITVQAKSITLRLTSQFNTEGLKFSTGEKTAEVPFQPAQTGDIKLLCEGFHLNVGIFAQDLGVKSIDSITEAPSSGYTIGGMLAIQLGHSYALKLADGKYAVIEVINDSPCQAGPQRTTMLRYKYQPNGSRTF